MSCQRLITQKISTCKLRVSGPAHFEGPVTGIPTSSSSSSSSPSGFQFHFGGGTPDIKVEQQGGNSTLALLPDAPGISGGVFLPIEFVPEYSPYTTGKQVPSDATLVKAIVRFLTQPGNPASLLTPPVSMSGSVEIKVNNTSILNEDIKSIASLTDSPLEFTLNTPVVTADVVEVFVTFEGFPISTANHGALMFSADLHFQ